MVKKKKTNKVGGGDLIQLPGPLDKQILNSCIAKQKYKPKKKNDTPKEKFIDASLSSKILQTARQQLHEDAAEGGSFGSESLYKKKRIVKFSDQKNENSDDESAADFVEAMDELIVDPKEEESFNKFRRLELVDSQQQKTLRDFVQEKISNKKTEFNDNFSNAIEIEVREMDSEVAELFRQIGQILTNYRSGKIPKAFKIIPTMDNWEQILEITCPDKWSSAAMFQATKLFAANANPSMCQRFYNLVLLPRIRDDIDEFKKLNYHLYNSLFKSMFKPAAFFKGILLPLCKVFGSVLRKVSIPQLHAAAAILNIAEMDYSAASSYLLRVLIEKNYGLPFRAVDGVVFHFLKMRSYKSDEPLPVIWHQSLLSFVRNYAEDISTEQKESIRDLIKLHSHHLISPEIHKMLQTGTRDEESEKNVPDNMYEQMDLESY